MGVTHNKDSYKNRPCRVGYLDTAWLPLGLDYFIEKNPNAGDKESGFWDFPLSG